MKYSLWLIILFLCLPELMAFPCEAVMLHVLLSCVSEVEGAKFTFLLSLPNNSVPFSVGRIGASALIAMDTVNQSPDLLIGKCLMQLSISDSNIKRSYALYHFKLFLQGSCRYITCSDWPPYALSKVIQKPFFSFLISSHLSFWSVTILNAMLVFIQVTAWSMSMWMMSALMYMVQER